MNTSCTPKLGNSSITLLYFTSVKSFATTVSLGHMFLLHFPSTSSSVFLSPSSPYLFLPFFPSLSKIFSNTFTFHYPITTSSLYFISKNENFHLKSPEYVIHSSPSCESETIIIIPTAPRQSTVVALPSIPHVAFLQSLWGKPRCPELLPVP